jgi:hypothetical protein
MLKSIIAVVAGFLMIAILSLATGEAVRALVPGAFDAGGGVDSIPLLLFSLAYVGVFAIAGCYVAARLAPSRPMLHALVLGALGLLFNIAASLAMWHTAPAWYHVVALALVMPYAWAGGRLRERELERAGAPAAAR